MYQLSDELALVPEWLHAIDRNNVDGSGHANQHVFISDYLIPSSTVDKFKDNVNICPGAKNQLSTPLPCGHKNEWCADNWMAANSISEGPITVFQKTGSFLSACRHSIIGSLVMCQSREL